MGRLGGSLGAMYRVFILEREATRPVERAQAHELNLGGKDWAGCEEGLEGHLHHTAFRRRRTSTGPCAYEAPVLVNWLHSL